MITCDNASNNNTMMTSLAELLRDRAAIHEFDATGNRIRCFPHVVNLAMKAGCQALQDCDANSEGLTEDEQAELEDLGFTTRDLSTNAALDDDLLYQDTLRGDVIGALRTLINALRASGHRRREFKQTIRELNEKNPIERHLRVRSLLRDMDVRWSSTFLMIDRALELAPVRCAFIRLSYIIDKKNSRLLPVCSSSLSTTIFRITPCLRSSTRS
jgi:hypothetical protein